MTTSGWLRPWRQEDAAALLAAHRASTDLARQTGPIDDVDAAGQVITSYNADVAAGSAYIWAIVEADEALGAVGVSRINRTHRLGWCWYWLSAGARGRGLATGALLAAAQFAYTEGLFRLELGHRLDNPASCSVASRAGFIAEGIERSKLEYDGQRFDCETHARLATDPAPGGALPIHRSDGEIHEQECET